MPSESQFTICTIGLVDREEMIFHAILRIFRGKLSHISNWQKADILLVEQSQRSTYTAFKGAVISILGESDTLQSDEWSIKRPIRAQKLQELLDQVLDYIQGNTSSQEKIQNIQANIAQQNYTKAESSDFVSYIRSNLNHDHQVSMSASGIEIYIDFSKNTYYPNQFTSSQVLQLLQQPFQKLKLNTISKATLENQINLATEQSIFKLLWNLAINSQTAILLPELAQQQTFSLKRWPDPQKLSLKRPHIRLSSFMVQNTANIQTISSATQIPEPQVINFINGCSLVGLLKQSAQASTSKTRKKTVSKGLLTGLRKRLGLQNG